MIIGLLWDLCATIMYIMMNHVVIPVAITILAVTSFFDWYDARELRIQGDQTEHVIDEELLNNESTSLIENQ